MMISRKPIQKRKLTMVSAKVFAIFSLTLSGINMSAPAQADVPTIPSVVSFTISPDSLDIVTTNRTVTFDLIVNNPAGISSPQTLVTLTDGVNNSLVYPILRTDSPLNNSLERVEFKGSFTLPNTLPAGAYTATAAPIIGLNSAGGIGYSTQTINATSTSTILGAKNALLVRSGGNLNFAYATFVGPTFSTSHSNIFINPKYNSVAAPVWRVGETFNPSDFYELAVPTLTLKVKTTTPTTCTSDGARVSLLATGSCEFIVYTDKTLDYQYKQDAQVVVVTAGRTKPSLSVSVVSTQSSKTLPLTIEGPFVYGVTGIVFPVSSTPLVCYPVGSYITIISGGTCTLNYSTGETSSYLASDSYPMTFQITREAQTLTFILPTTANLANKVLVLKAAASSGAGVSFQSNSASICSVTGNSLNLLAPGTCQVQASAPGSTTISPASVTQSISITGSASQLGKKPVAQKIACEKNGKSKTFRGTKCPAGFKAKK
jgi:hypothetical protein